MARQLRIDFPGAFYHVYSRGNQKQVIFLNDEERFFFLKVLGDTGEKFGIRFIAYCLMPNHYHLFFQALLGKLSRSLHLINTAYTVYLNKKHDRIGHLFQGRFKSILVEGEVYAKELTRYIHLNPVRAGIVSRPEEYRWSSYQDYLGRHLSQPYVDVSFILGCQGLCSQQDRERYERYVLAGIGAAPPVGYEESRHSGILGSQEFMKHIKRESKDMNINTKDRERPQLRYFRRLYEIPEVLDAAEKELGPQNKFTKGLAIFICRDALDMSLSDLCGYFSLSLSGIYSARHRIRAEIERNIPLARSFRRIVERLDRSNPRFPSKSNEK